MQFEFSAVIEGANCHIRASEHNLIPNEVVNDHPHKHFFMEFHYVFDGEEIIHLPAQRRQIHLQPGQLLLLPYGVYHGVTTGDKTVERICFNFSAEPVGGGASPIIERLLEVKEVLLFENTEANTLLLQCRKLWLEDDNSLFSLQRGMLLLNTVFHILSILSSAKAPQMQEVSHAMRQRWIIEEHVEKHFTDQRGIEGLSKALHLSQRQTRTLVKRYLCEDYKGLIIRRRMELAEIFLQDPEKSLEEIAWEVGYRSYSGFQLCFKKHFGITPSQMRKLINSRQI